MANTKKRLAVLIDGDNAQASLLPYIMAEVDKHGEAIIRRIYGDWTQSGLNSWKKGANDYSFTPFQQFGYTTGKNSTDGALIVDAMDILHTKEVDGFCIVSSDSDYTRLATRIREDNFFVLGIGRKDTVKSFVNACTQFIFTDTLKPKKTVVTPPMPEKKPVATAQSSNGVSAKNQKKMRKLFKQAFDLATNPTSWIGFGELGKLSTIAPDLDKKSYGDKDLSKLVLLYPETVEVRTSDSKGKTIYQVRKK